MLPPEMDRNYLIDDIGFRNISRNDHQAAFWLAVGLPSFHALETGKSFGLIASKHCAPAIPAFLQALKDGFW